MTKGNLGRMGETYFNNLCSTVNLNCNSSNEDNTGWDFIVEFPHEFDLAVLADKSPAAKEFKVQIKATNDNKRKLPIKISNLMRLCTTPLPAFIIFLEYNNKPQPEDMFIVHIGKDIMFDVLKRARENSVSKARKNFNNTTLTIKYGPQHRMSDLSGDTFISIIKNNIPSGMDMYVDEKRELLKNLGYEKSSGQLQFKTTTEVANEDMISASLGWLDKVKVSNVLAYDTRFDILSPIDEMSSQEAVISFSIDKSAIPSTITFTNTKTKKRIKQDCDLFFSQVASILPQGMSKFRVKGSSFDMLVSLNGSKTEYKFIDETAILSPYIIRDSLFLMRWFMFQDDEIEISITPKKQKHSAKFITSAGQNLNRDKEFENLLNHLDYSVATIIDICSLLNIEHALTTSIMEIRDNLTELNYIAQIINNNMQPFEALDFRLENKSSGKEFKGETVCGLVFSCEFNETLIVVIVTAKGIAEKNGDNYVLHHPIVTLEDINEFSTLHDNDPEIIKNLDAITASYLSEGYNFINFIYDYKQNRAKRG